jgi:LysM repeat protein
LENLCNFESAEEKVIMVKKSLLLYFLLLVGIAFGQTVKIPISTDIQARNGKQFYVHTVQKGQTLYSIARAYKVGLDEIYYANPETKQGIRIGQKIWIPTVNKETEIKHEIKASNFDFFYHVAAAGETLDHISSIYLIPKRYILLANPGITSPLKEGEYVKIPVESAYPILDGKVTGAAASKTYTGGIHPQKPIELPVTTATLPASASSSLTGQEQHRSPAKSAESFNPDIPTIKDYRHIVIPGETLESIAKKYGISKADLLAVNPGLISTFQGERLRLPVTAKVPGYHPSAKALQKARKYETAKTTAGKAHNSRKVSQSSQQHAVKQGFITHIVKKKETLYSISRLYGLKPEDLYKANPGLTSNISIGQSIRIPKKKISTDFVYYQARKKISLKKVAKLYGVELDMLVNNNPSVGRKVIPGQVVRIPVGAQAIELAKNQEKSKIKPAGEPEKTGQKTSSTANAFGRCQARPHNRTFKVALMVPLYLEETDSINLTEFMIRQQKNFVPFRFVEFLEGALIASDSLKEQGMNLKLYVYDVDQTLTKTAKVLTRPELKQMNLIIGPFYSRSFNQVALFANHFGIPIVNPLTFRNGILRQYNNVVKVTPDENTELSQVSHLIQNDYVRDKVFVISQTSYKDAREVSALRDSIRKVLPDSVSFPNFDLINIGIAVTQRGKDEERLEKEKENPNLINTTSVTKITFNDTLDNYHFENQPVNPELLKDYQYDTSNFSNRLIYINYARDSLHPFDANASVLRNNLVVLYGTNKSFIMDAMNRLNVLRDTFNIKMIGLPAWETISSLNLQQMNNMETTYPGSYFVDFTTPEYERFSTKFYRHYATSPGRYGVLGFDITYYFLKSIFLYGNRFLQCLPNHISRGISTQYKFMPVNTGNNNYENTYWNWLRIKDKQLLKLSDTLLESHPRQAK